MRTVSPPAWGRGLKHHCQTLNQEQNRSPLVWGRGLKHETPILLNLFPVAPRVGAWIETIWTAVWSGSWPTSPLAVGAWIETSYA